nr:hypothetical protein [Odoribacter splanchnicus]
MKFLLIYGVLFLLLWTKGSAIDREESLTDYTVEEGIVNESVLVEVPSSDLKTNYIPYFLYLKVLNPATQIDLSAGSDQSWNILSYLKSASNLNGNLNCSKELEHYAS